MGIRRHTRVMLGAYLLTCCIYGNFLALSSVVALNANIICNKIPTLAPKQRLVCKSRPDAFIAMGEGAKLGGAECRFQFMNMRWNCTSINGDKSMFGYEELGATKEAAFIYAITSAGVTYAITKACSTGNLSNCGCDQAKKDGEVTSAGWKWGGCSVDVKYGLKMARKFMDAREIAKDDRALMNLHNNRAGRKAVKDNMSTDCKCHGVSGSCTVKTCWTTLPPFRKIGDALKKRYKKAKLVASYVGGRSRQPISLILKRSKRPHRKPRRSHLVFLIPSPNYCDYDESVRSLGTKGRSCNRTSNASEGCDLMCCGRGYNTHQHTRNYKCSCKFHWCCQVQCENCSERTEQYTCK
ncbi:protein Wnt-7b-like isoform X1 [Biomphalaria glabrata]|uniref:Protein Wnt n=2 Tax=Biomphalaria glabrata TaxID=6526 RepID=A0A9U8DW72_BIOGL|nr:protein Wnt-7b-like isoform X1 [Biomphalaria glabrata]XP_013064030.2 protein Wnt-7b-like isoform X1 [Biomphalaria glabrata]